MEVGAPANDGNTPAIVPAPDAVPPKVVYRQEGGEKSKNAAKVAAKTTAALMQRVRAAGAPNSTATGPANSGAGDASGSTAKPGFRWWLPKSRTR